MMSPDEPLLKIADGAVSERYDRLGSLPEILPQRLCTREVFEAGDRQSRERLSPSV
jgi:hypothetical protein